MVLTLLKSVIKSFSRKLLDIDSSENNSIKSIHGLLQKHEINCSSASLEEFVQKLKRKHLLIDVSMARFDGSLIASTSKDGFKKSIIGSALMSYIKSEINEVKRVLIKENDWFILMPLNGILYIIRTDCSLTGPELHAIADDFQEFIKTSSIG